MLGLASGSGDHYRLAGDDWADDKNQLLAGRGRRETVPGGDEFPGLLDESSVKRRPDYKLFEQAAKLYWELD